MPHPDIIPFLPRKYREQAIDALVLISPALVERLKAALAALNLAGRP